MYQLTKTAYYAVINSSDQELKKAGMDMNTKEIDSNSTLSRLLNHSLDVGYQGFKGNAIGSFDSPSLPNSVNIKSKDFLFDYFVLGFSNSSTTVKSVTALLDSYLESTNSPRQFIFYRAKMWGSKSLVWYLLFDLGNLFTLNGINNLVNGQSDYDLELSELLFSLSNVSLYNVTNNSIITLPDSACCYNEHYREFRNTEKYALLSDYDEHDANDHTVTNLSDVLQDKLGDKLISDPKIKVNMAGDLVARAFPPVLLDTPGSDLDNLVFFNPITGMYVHDTDVLSSLIRFIKPYAPKREIDTMFSQFAAEARNDNRFITPYSGSRYLLFNNGCLDVKEMKLYPLDSSLVSSLHFTTRSHLNLDFKFNPACPVLPNMSKSGGDWTPEQWIKAYADNDSEKLTMLLFGLSLGLFGGHNFGVHFDIQGQSRWGKSTLNQIFKNLFNNIMVINWPKLNGSFPFTNYMDNTSIIWISECNVGAKPLNDEATALYDGLADGRVSLQIKNKNDLTIDNPPQVYIDGTQLMEADEKSTGPLGRTIPFELPSSTNKLQDQMMVNRDINIILSQNEVLQWLVWKMINAYRTIVPDNQIDSFRVHDAGSDDIMSKFPDEAKKWRDDMNISGDDVTIFFEEHIASYVNTTNNPNDGNATILHHVFLYTIYKQFRRDINALGPNEPDKYLMGRDRFSQKIDRLLDQFGYRKIPVGNIYKGKTKPQKKVSDYHSMGFDWSRYTSDHGLPHCLRDPSNLPSPFKRVLTGWFKIIRK